MVRTKYLMTLYTHKHHSYCFQEHNYLNSIFSGTMLIYITTAKNKNVFYKYV